MYKETLQQIVRGSRSRTHVQTQPTTSAFVNENLPLPDSEPWEMKENPLPLEAGPMSRTTPRAETRMPMSELPPSEEPVPMQDAPPPHVDMTPVRRGTRTRKPPAYLADYQ